MLFISILALAFVIGHYETYVALKCAGIESTQQGSVTAARAALAREFQEAVSDLCFLTDNITAAYAHSAQDHSNPEALTALYLQLGSTRLRYAQVRLLDVARHSWTRVQYQNGLANSVRTKYQQPGDPPWLSMIAALDTGTLYLGTGNGFDPSSASFQLGAPIRGPDGTLRNILVLDIPTVRFFAAVMSTAGAARDTELMFLDAQGAIVYEKGRTTPDHVTTASFAQGFPQAWERITSTPTAQFTNQHGSFSFASLYPVDEQHAKVTTPDTDGVFRWTVVGRIKQSEIAALRETFTRQFLPGYAGVYALFMLLASVGGYRDAQRERRTGQGHAIQAAGDHFAESDNRLRQLSQAVEQSPASIMITDKDARIDYVNPKFTRVTGYSLEEVRGKTPRFLQSGDTDPLDYDALWEQINAGKEWRGTFHNCKKNGNLYWESASISPIFDAHGNITHFLAVKEDITELKHLKAQLQDHSAELQKNRELANMGRMADMIAHDLRNPLSSVKMAMQILSQEASPHLDDKAAELIDIGLDQIHYMEEILRDLLSYSKPDALRLAWVDVNKVLDDAINSLQREIADHHAQVRCEYQHRLPTVNGDELRLRQVFANLIANALQAGSEGGHAPEVVITTRMPVDSVQDGVQIEILDNGAGIDADVAESLFEPFVTTRAKGTGLGLAIVQRIIDQHHGSVRLKNAGTGGARALVRLPTGPVEPA